MCMSSPRVVATPPPPPPPPQPTAVAAAPEASKALAKSRTRRKRGTSRLTVTRRPSLGMQSGQSGVQLPS